MPYVKRLIFDAAVMTAIVVVIIYFSYFAEPHRRGFFCNDPDLSHPYLDSSVPSWLLYTLGTIVPFLTVVTVEWTRVPT